MLRMYLGKGKCYGGFVNALQKSNDEIMSQLLAYDSEIKMVKLRMKLSLNYYSNAVDYGEV